ncbi:MAG: TIGR03617 family F420-dependent LLM class oxidoreductase [Frankiales bacterium]|nr:TIGR03617 family F420-dependent LLM class oxidoreductase [Frankiales bacterium]
MGSVPVDVLLDAELADVPAQLAALAAAGAAGAFTFEGPRDPFLPLACAAAAPGGLTLYTNLAIALPRSPMHLAQQAWDLQRASGGRFLLGMGTQVRRHVEQRYGARWESPVEQMREWLLAIRAIFAAWQERVPLDFVGRWTRHTYLPPLFDPGPLPAGPPPLVVGAVGPRMLAMATETADGLLVHPFSTVRTMTEHTLPAIAAGLDAAGRKPADFIVIGQVMVAVGRDDEELEAALQRARAQVAFYGSTPAYRVMLDVHGWGDLQPELHQLVREQRWSELPKVVPDEVVQAFVCSGPPDAVAAQLRDRAEGVDRLALSSFASPDARLALLEALR